MCVFSEIGFWLSLYVFSLGGRLLNPTKPLWAWTDKMMSPHALPQTPQPKQMKSIMNQVRKMKMTINGHDSSSWKQQTKKIPLNLNVFTLRKAVDGMANGRPKQCKPMKSDSIFIEVEKKRQSKNLLRTTMLMSSIPVKVTPHRTLNSRKFVIKCVELDNIDEEEIKKGTRTTRNYCC